MNGFREYTITYRTDDYICRDGYDLSLEDVLEELTAVCEEEFEDEALDLVVWEADRVLAVLRHHGVPGLAPTVARFDFQPVAV